MCHHCDHDEDDLPLGSPTPRMSFGQLFVAVAFALAAAWVVVSVFSK